MILGQKIKEFDKQEINNFSSNFTNTKYDNIGGVTGYVLRIVR